MVLRMYCDECGKELEEDENAISDRIRFESRLGYLFEVMATNKERRWNAGHLCESCFKKLVSTSTMIKKN